LINPKFPFRNAVFVLILTPLIVPVVVSGLGFYLFFSKLGLLHSFPGIILAHTVLATPFVVVTVTATLSRFDFNLMRAATSLGASRLTAFRTVMLPMIAPGVVAGGVFAFITSFDEVVAVLFIAGPEQRTLPRQLFSGMREQLEPTIISASIIVIILTVVLMLLAGRLQRQKV
jgi:putative spermidine/putrescine transport system permease protein